jgi:hypothetical protein
VLQPLGLALTPLCVPVIFAFPWLYAFCQSASALDGGEEGLRALTGRVWRQTFLWPRQNLTLQYILSPLALLLATALYLVILPVATEQLPLEMRTLLYIAAGFTALLLTPLNPAGVLTALAMAAVVMMLPTLTRLLGMESALLGYDSAFFSTTMLATVVSLAFLVLDPIMKAAFVLRCFYGESIKTGEDLKSALRALDLRRGAAILLLAAAVLGAAPAMAQPPADIPASAARLDEAIDQTLQQREFLWRMPTEPALREALSQSWFARKVGDAMEWLSEGVEAIGNKIGEWLDWIFGRETATSGTSSGGWTGGVDDVLIVLAVLLAGVVLFLIWRTLRRGMTEEIDAEPLEVQPVPDVADEATTADALPEDEWLRLGEELLAKGETRLALRALFLAGLAGLGARGLVGISPFKSNRDYLRELQSRAHALPGVAPSFQDVARAFEAVWYGSHRSDAMLYREVRGKVERTLALCAEQAR